MKDIQIMIINHSYWSKSSYCLTTLSLFILSAHVVFLSSDIEERYPGTSLMTLTTPQAVSLITNAYTELGMYP